MPMGLGPPSSKQFCWACHAILHETNAASVIHLPEQPSGSRETRSRRAADPPPRAGSASIALQAGRLLAAQERHRAGHSKKPEPMDYDSCIAMPLIYVDGPPVLSVSTMALHVFLGLSMHVFKLFEEELRQQDAIWAAMRSETLADPKVQAALEQAQAAVLAMKNEIEEHKSEITCASEQLEVIEQGPGGVEAVERCKKKGGRRPAAWGAPSIAEIALKDATKARNSAQAALKTVERALPAAEREVVDLYNSQAGPFVRSFYALMDSLNLQRQAYHSGAFTGKDAKKTLEPEVAKAFARLLYPHLRVELHVAEVEAEEGVPHVSLDLKNTQGVGDAGRAAKYKRIWQLLGLAVSLWTRFEPVCEHEVCRFKALVVDIAHLWCELFPSHEPPPKLHMMLYHMITQLEWFRSTGQFHEGVVESFHVLDNRLFQRFAHVKNAEDQVRARANAAFQLTDPRSKSIRRLDRERERIGRQKRNRAERTSHAERDRRQRLEEEESMDV